MKGFLLMDKIKQIELFIRKLNINQKIKIIDHCKNQYSIRHLWTCQEKWTIKVTFY
ncbi:hypothetical protein [Spiroplasma endosymbiont of Lariophagus distinguendus]|uniref:hypothetical protein n=1 Tax=Spiroplasma endosymbiont of Lariophagus distinguendus TaxID=2935082 RepID=UPI00207A08F1|nr:hypothetical protein [Spiroplasma endosymbiont of Lariophagus distinguendus]